MATRSTIALEFADGTVGQIYAHWDGYIEHNGKILFEHYLDPFKVKNLIELGSLSSLGPEIGQKHAFDNPFKYGTTDYDNWNDANRKVCTFYGRDRGEQGVEASYFKDFADYEANHEYQEYEYILRNVGGEAVWYVFYDEGYERLDSVLKKSVDEKESA